MGKEAKKIKELFQDIIQYIRVNHAGTVDKAYSYFWDNENPDEFIGGTALSIGFHNFEEWMVYDYKVNEKGETFIDLFIKDRKDLPEDSSDLLLRVKNSVLSLYEVSSVSKDKHLLLNDILLEREIALRDRSLSKGLKKGDLFATRILELDGHYMMSGCVYPYLPGHKKEALAKIGKQFGRYVRNVKPGGTMQEYLKDYGDIFNLIWLEFIGTPQENKEKP